MKQTKEQRLVKKLSKRPEIKTPIATEIYIPNHSGDHSAGRILTTPTEDHQIANKKYVDDSIPTTYWNRNGLTNTIYPISNSGLLISGTTGSTPTSGAGTRLMWIPAKGAFRAGQVTLTYWDDLNIGTNSFAVGKNTRAKGTGSACFGDGTDALQEYSTAFGYNNTIDEKYAVAFGRQNYITGYSSVAFGFNNQVDGGYSLVGGSGSECDGNYSIAWGGSVSVEGIYSFGIGSQVNVSANSCFAFGKIVTASEEYSFAGGIYSYAQGYTSFANGYNCRAFAQYSRATGNQADSTQQSYKAFACGKFNNRGDAQQQVVILRGDAAAYETVLLDTPEAYEIPADATVLGNLHIVIRCNDGTSAYAVRRICMISNSSQEMTIEDIQTIGTDVDPDEIIDDIDIYADSELLAIDVTLDYDDEFGVVAKLEVIENLYEASGS